jgi:hypothetical protein
VAYNRQPDRDHPGQSLRIERRLKPRVRLPELIGLANPFINLIAVATAPLRPLITGIHQAFRFDQISIDRSTNLPTSMVLFARCPTMIQPRLEPNQITGHRCSA